MRMKIIAAALLCLLGGVAQADDQEKAIAEAGVAKIQNFYQNSIVKLSLSGDKVQDISLACMGEIYLVWFNVYDSVIQRTPNLNYGEVSNYRMAEQRAHLIESDRMIYNKIRPDLSSRILAEIDTRRDNRTWSAGPDKITLEDVHEADLMANLKSCTNNDFVAAIDKGYVPSPNDLNQKITITITPYVPKFKVGEAATAVPPVYGGIDDTGMSQSTDTYANWLNNILMR